MLKQAFLVTVLLGAAAPVLAGTPGLNHREHHQQARIIQGIRSGELTRPEAHRLLRGEQRLHRSEWRAKADGKVTARERVQLHRQADRMSKRIYRQKHDRQRR